MDNSQENPHVIVRHGTNRFNEIRDRLVAAGADPFDILEEGEGKKLYVGNIAHIPWARLMYYKLWDIRSRNQFRDSLDRLVRDAQKRPEQVVVLLDFRRNEEAMQLLQTEHPSVFVTSDLDVAITTLAARVVSAQGVV